MTSEDVDGQVEAVAPELAQPAPRPMEEAPCLELMTLRSGAKLELGLQQQQPSMFLQSMFQRANSRSY